jgi:hypothetical protein
MCQLAQQNIAIARRGMHTQQGPCALKLSPNSVVLDRLGLLEEDAIKYISKMAAVVSVWCVCCTVRLSWRGGCPGISRRDCPDAKGLSVCCCVTGVTVLCCAVLCRASPQAGRHQAASRLRRSPSTARLAGGAYACGCGCLLLALWLLRKKKEKTATMAAAAHANAHTVHLPLLVVTRLLHKTCRLWGARVLTDRLREDAPQDLQSISDAWGVRTNDVTELIRRAGWSPRLELAFCLRCELARVTNVCRLLPLCTRHTEGFAATVSAFCVRLGYWEVHAAIRSFVKRVYATRVADNQPGGLADIRNLKGPRARLLFEQGIKTVQQMARLEPQW